MDLKRAQKPTKEADLDDVVKEHRELQKRLEKAKADKKAKLVKENQKLRREIQKIENSQDED